MDNNENPFLYTIRLPAKISPKLVKASTLLHFFSLFIPWISALDFYLKLIFTLVPIVSFVHFYKKFIANTNQKRVIEIILNSDDSWQLLLANGQSCLAETGRFQFIHPLLTIINLRNNRKQYYFIVTPDIIQPDEFRRLRVRLKYPLS